MTATTDHKYLDPDATWRRASDPDETERRPFHPEQEADPDATERRPAPRADATKRTIPIEPETAQSAALHQTFPVTFQGKREQLEITGRLGRGGEGELFLCTLSGRPYVTKILQQDSDYEVLSAMVERHESLEGRHLVPCLYLGRMSDVEGSGLDARRYIVHPYYAKGDLTALENVRRINPSIAFDGDESAFRPQAESYRHVTCDYSKVDEEAFQDLVAQLGKALNALHAVSFASGTAGAVHRDIKPQNIFVDENGRYALGDFGLVSAMSSGSTMKFTQRIGLSHGYSPPEAYSDRAFKQTVTRKYDYFSLGMSLLHIAGGRPRYIIDNELAQSDPRVMTIGDFYETIMMSAVSVPNDLPRRIRNLIRGLLAADPDHRWGAREVSAWLKGENPLIHSADAPGSEGIAIRAGAALIRGAQETAGELLRGWNIYARMLEDEEDGLPFAWDGAEETYRQAVERAAQTAQFEDPDIGLQRLILTIYPQMGHAFRGRRFESDDALGRAMYAAAETENSREIAFFTEYLTKGALSSAWRTSGARRAEEALRAVMRLEAGAQKRPGAALRAAASMLMGAGAPPVRVRAGDELLTFSCAGELSSWVRTELERSLDQYRRPIFSGSVPRIPGTWNAGGSEVLRQTDGSILLRTSAATEPFPVSGALLSVASAVASLRGEDARTGDALSAMLFSDGYTGTIECTGTGSTGDGFLPAVLLDFLALFPDIRGGELDDVLTGMLDAFLDRTRYIRAAKLPFSSSSRMQRIDLAANQAKDAAAVFSRTRSFADFAQAVRQANETRALLSGLRDINYDAAKAALALAPKVMSSSDQEAKERFSEIAEEYQKSAGDAQHIERLLRSLEEFQGYFADRARSDLSPYMLSDTMLFIRNYNQTSAQPMSIVLPNTMDAKEYYEKLTDQVSRQRRRLVDAGLGDEDGNVRA